jgi:BirA family biotin operon repressor/biotin-[acetyl-CoA-carboxylase] ligase
LRSLPADALLESQLRRLFAAGADPATVVRLDRDDRLDCAVLLAPEHPLRRARLIVYAGALGLGDGLGAVMPPGVDVTFRWPATVLANLGAVGRIGLVLPDDTDEDSVPRWMALRLTVAVASPADQFETTLHDEGCAGLAAAHVLESFARHFLSWVNRWMDDGFEPVRAMWLRHAPDHGKRFALRLGRRKTEGNFSGIDDNGALILEAGDAIRRIDLRVALGT